MVSTPILGTSESSPDGRIHLIGILILYFAAIFLSSLFMPYDVFWDKLQVPAFSTFSDIPPITREALENVHLRENFFCAPACYWFAHLGLRDSHTFVAGMVMNLIFFVALLLQIGRVRRDYVAFYAAIFCSPPVMMGVARANIDLLIFALLCLSIWLFLRSGGRWRPVSYALIIYGAMLKFHPIFASVLALGERAWRRIAGLAALTAAFFGYVWYIRDDLREMYPLAPRPITLSFGAPVLLMRIVGGVIPPWCAPVSLGLSLALVLAAWVTAMRRGAATTDENDSKTLGLRIGSAIYIGSFALIQFNYIYRFVFLLLAIPQWLKWREEGGRMARLATAVLAAMVIGFWLPRYVRNFWNLDQAADWFLFFASSYALLVSLPADIRRLLRIAEPPAPDAIESN